MRFAAANFHLAALSLVLAVSFAPSPAPAQTTGDPQPSQQIDAPSAAPAKAKKRLSKDFTLKSDSIWTDTGIDLKPGEKIVVAASGVCARSDGDTASDGSPSSR